MICVLIFFYIELKDVHCKIGLRTLFTKLVFKHRGADQQCGIPNHMNF